jgi:hypothetical protein
MATKAQLILALDRLITQADEQEQLYQSSRDKLYTVLAETYVWWRDAVKIEGFLEELYDSHNIKSRGAEEKFTRILRLIWQKDWSGKESATLQTWSNALRAVHQEVDSNSQEYKSNTATKISQFIHSKGGLRGILNNAREVTEFLTDDVKNTSKRSNPKIIENSLEIKRKHLELGQQYFAKVQRYLANIVTNKSTLISSKDGYAVALVKLDSKNPSKSKLLSVSADETLINETIIKTYKRNTENIPYTLRLLGEVIKTQSLPIALENHRDHLLEKSKVLSKDGVAMRQMKRIVIRSSTKDILLSETRTDCSVVTIVKPNTPIVNSRDDLILRINDHRYIEQEIVQTDDVAFNTSLSENIKKVNDAEIKASYKLEIKNTVTNKIRNIYFYRYSELHEGNRFQSDINKQSIGKFIWSATANREWLENLNNVFTSRWLSELGNQINRKHYKQFRLNLSRREFSICYDGVRDSFDKTESAINLPLVRATSKPLKILLMSKDVLTVFNALSNNDDISSVVISANENVMEFKYKTSLGQYEIYLPTSKIQNKLIRTSFIKYQ